MDKNGVPCCCFLHEIEELFAGCVPAEVVDFDSAVKCNLWQTFIKSDGIAWLGGPDFSSGAVRISVANEEEHVLWVVDESSGKPVGSGFLRHHSAGKRVDCSGLEGDAFAAPPVARDESHVWRILKLGWSRRELPENLS